MFTGTGHVIGFTLQPVLKSKDVSRERVEASFSELRVAFFCFWSLVKHSLILASTSVPGAALGLDDREGCFAREDRVGTQGPGRRSFFMSSLSWGLGAGLTSRSLK